MRLSNKVGAQLLDGIGQIGGATILQHRPIRPSRQSKLLLFGIVDKYEAAHPRPSCAHPLDCGTAAMPSTSASISAISGARALCGWPGTGSQTYG